VALKKCFGAVADHGEEGFVGGGAEFEVVVVDDGVHAVAESGQSLVQVGSPARLPARRCRGAGLPAPADKLTAYCARMGWTILCRPARSSTGRCRTGLDGWKDGSRLGAPGGDAVAVGGESVGDASEDGLGAAGDVDLAVDGADVGLDGVRAEVGQCGAFRVAAALGDQRRGLPLPGRSGLLGGRAIPVRALRARGGGSLTTTSPVCTASSAATSSRAVSVLDR
jgi:hypothetical protein